MDDGGAVAAVDGLAVVRQRLIASLGEELAEAIVRVCRASADFVVKFHNGGLIDGQVHRHRAVAVVRGGQLLGVITSCGVRFVIPDE